jgi:hypothetical protein
MSRRLPGETSLTTLQRELGLKPRGLAKLREVLRDASHATTQTLKAMDVEYITRGKTRAAKSFLVKHQPA